MYTLLVVAALIQPPAEPAAPGGSPPEQVLASIDARGKLTITHVTCACYGPATRETNVTVKGEKAKVRTTSLVVTTTELPAKFVEAFTTDGKTIAADKLPEMLAKERTVLIALDLYLHPVGLIL